MSSFPGSGRCPGGGTGNPLQDSWASLVAQMIKNLPAMQETWVQSLGSIPGSGRSPGKGKGYPLQYSCLEKPMDRGAWWATSMGSQIIRHNRSDLAVHTPTPRHSGEKSHNMKHKRNPQTYRNPKSYRK